MNGQAGGYDHRNHAGNAGDVWKHFILMEVAEQLLSERTDLVYAESHVGRPEYSLVGRGEWMGGIGRCWDDLSQLLDYQYFRILAEMNPHGLRIYPGSTQLVLRAAASSGSSLQAEVWDADPAVARSWQGRAGVRMHIGDGFSGVRSLLEEVLPGLLLIDPPYIHPDDMEMAAVLFARAKRAGWIALWWQMTEGEQSPEEGYERLDLQFSETKMEGGRWKRATIALAGADDDLLRHLWERANGFREALKWPSCQK
jgi:23S rRNA (adenine2030-N6)-methyltransferase